MKRAAWLLLPLAAAVFGCRRSPDSGGPPAELAQPAPSASTPGAPTKDEAIQSAWQAFKATADKGPQERRAAYTALVALVSGQEAAAVAGGVPDLRTGTIQPLLHRLAELERQEQGAALPPVPDKPEHDAPKYMGAFPLGGRVHTCYKDGVLLQSAKKYYFIKDAVCPDAPLLHGFVEDTGETIMADVGRDGREATVVRIADRESASDDRAAHRKAVAEYEKDYREKTEEYRKALADRQAAERALGPDAKARSAEMEKLRKQIDGALVAVLKGGTAPSASAPSPSSTAMSIDSLPTAEAAGAPAKGATVNRGGDAATPAANAPPAAGGGEDKKKKRQQCVQSCVAGCHDDPGCERACVSSKCG